jgi:predicted DNA-binding transcriptional regulator AlpA
MLDSVLHNYVRGSFFILPSSVRIGAFFTSINHGHFPVFVYNFCMMLVMVKEADLNRIEVPEDYEVLDATALGRRLGFKRDTVLAYLSRRNFGRIPRPNRLLAMGPIWYEKSVREWEAKVKGRTRGR